MIDVGSCRFVYAPRHKARTLTFFGPHDPLEHVHVYCNIDSEQHVVQATGILACRKEKTNMLMKSRKSRLLVIRSTRD